MIVTGQGADGCGVGADIPNIGSNAILFTGHQAPETVHHALTGALEHPQVVQFSDAHTLAYMLQSPLVSNTCILRCRPVHNPIEWGYGTCVGPCVVAL